MNSIVGYLKSGRSDYLGQIKLKDLDKAARKKSLILFQEAAVNVPAYKDFLKKNKINYKKIKNFSNFEKYVPQTTKENYIAKYSLKDRCWSGDISSIHTFATSSGSTGTPLFWPRSVPQEIDGAKVHELLFDKVFDVRNKKTLFINSFGLGNWIAGMFTEMCLYLLRLKNIPFTLASPGYNEEETFKVVKELSGNYDQTIIACHPPILKMMMENGRDKGINWQRLNVKFLGAGEGFSESWRENLLSLAGQKDVFKCMINIYGSADAGLMGFETPLSIYAKRELQKDGDTGKRLFGTDRLPYLYQFDPMMKYLEASDNGEITLTMYAPTPLIRYNIHDKGGIVKNSLLVNAANKISDNSLHKLSEFGVKISDWPFPFVYVFGRDRFMTTLYGVNIYPENIKEAFEHKDLQQYLTGRFIAEKISDKNQDQALLVRVELNRKTRMSKILIKRIRARLIRVLKRVNSEYNQVEQKYKQKMHPKVSLCKFQDPKCFPTGKIRKMA